MTAGDGGGDSSISLGGSLLQVLKAGLEGVSDGSHWVCGGGTPAAARAIPVAQLKGCDCRSDSGSTADHTTLACACVPWLISGRIRSTRRRGVNPIEVMGAALAAADLRLPEGLTFSQSVRWVRRHHNRALADRFGWAQTAHVQMYAIRFARLRGVSLIDSGVSSWPQAIRQSLWQGPVSTRALVALCKESGLFKHGAQAFGTPPYVASCQGCRRFFYLNDVRRTTCNGCRAKAERDKKRQQRGTDLSPRDCASCGVTFTPKRSDARCCSPKCRAKLSRLNKRSVTPVAVSVI
jgi:hypothetical protein